LFDDVADDIDTGGDCDEGLDGDCDRLEWLASKYRVLSLRRLIVWIVVKTSMTVWSAWPDRHHICLMRHPKFVQNWNIDGHWWMNVQTAQHKCLTNPKQKAQMSANWSQFGQKSDGDQQ
jgi:hypothetical protein